MGKKENETFEELHVKGKSGKNKKSLVSNLNFIILRYE